MSLANTNIATVKKTMYISSRITISHVRLQIKNLLTKITSQSTQSLAAADFKNF